MMAFYIPERSKAHLAMCVSCPELMAVFAISSGQLTRNRVALRSSTKSPERSKAHLAMDIRRDDSWAYFAQLAS